MNFKGSAFSAGGARIADSQFKDGKIYFLQSGGSAYDLKSFDVSAKKFATVEKDVSFADKCFFCEGELLELFGMAFNVAS
ncbi:MAG: hypothetical protein FWE84_04675 [Firmicutes bacterium]|nr:hypothetical protein [Bacillota bacterium]